MSWLHQAGILGLRLTSQRTCHKFFIKANPADVVHLIALTHDSRMNATSFPIVASRITAGNIATTPIGLYPCAT